MRNKSIPQEEKIRIVESCLARQVGKKEAAAIADVRPAAINAWIHQYQIKSPALFEAKNSVKASPETKLQAVLEYLTGETTQQAVCDKYGIRGRGILQHWIKVYNERGTFMKQNGGDTMKSLETESGRKTSMEERTFIVKECTEGGKTYHKAAADNGVSYQQVRSWVKKYQEMGTAGLEDRRGHRKGSLPARSKEEEYTDKLAIAEHQNHQLRMERDFLKKLKELERGKD